MQILQWNNHFPSSNNCQTLALIFFLKTKDLAPLAWLFLNKGLGTLCAGLSECNAK